VTIPPPTRLRVEHLDSPFGIDVREPRLSWRLPDGSRTQVAYRLTGDAWDSGRVESDRSVLVPYGGPALRSGQVVRWRVKVWTDAGESDWSEPASWEMGLLEASDWVARWIEPTAREHARIQRPARHLRCFFALDRPVVRARCYATAHGVYELFLNDHRVGDVELAPGFTSYSKRLCVQTYDVTDLLTVGENALGAVLSDGWFRGQVGNTRERDVFGDRLALLVQLHIELADGSRRVIATGPEWRWSDGAILGADLIEGQIVDLRRERAGWCSPGAAHEGWSDVRVVDYDPGVLCASPAPPVRRIEELRPVAVERFRPHRHVVDFGQNINGWVRLSNLGPTGTTLTLTHGEARDSAGDVTVEHLRPTHWKDQRLLSAGQVDVVTSAGRAGEVFEPRHTTHGFQYLRIDGHPGEVAADEVTGVVVHSDLRRTGWFRCSDDRINRLHDAAVWSFRGNACDVPTDCPTRERAPWTGDWQIFLPTAAFLYDVAGFATKWLSDLAADQRVDGVVRNFAPDIAPPGADEHPVKKFLEGSAGWGDAAVFVPWEIWRAYGDERVLERQWPSMVAWVEFEARSARSGRHPSRVERRPSPAPHEQYLWDTGFHWGEWCEPDREGDDFFAKHLGDDFGIIATAYFARSSEFLARVAKLLNREGDAERYARLASEVRAAWCTEFLTADGALRSDRQADYARALAFDLVPVHERAGIAARLVELIRAAGTHLNTGFLGTPYLLPVLADSGHLDVAYELLLQRTPPSWLAMIDRGATTIWEHWEGIDATGGAHASLNHYSKGAVVSFLHTHTAGIRILEGAPGYRRFLVAPMPGGGITWAEAAHDCPYGRIESSWRLEDGVLHLEVRVPAGTVAEVKLPDGRSVEAPPGRSTHRSLVPEPPRRA
jgi:alpha-L-rhamnosidase